MSDNKVEGIFAAFSHFSLFFSPPLNVTKKEEINIYIHFVYVRVKAVVTEFTIYFYSKEWDI